MKATPSRLCPVALRSGGGSGVLGLCAMELISLMEGQGYSGSTGLIHANDDSRSVHQFLRRCLIGLNDEAFASNSDDNEPIHAMRLRRADALWPLLPLVLGTDNVTLTEAFYADAVEAGYLATRPNRYATGEPLDVARIQIGFVRDGTVALKYSSESPEASVEGFLGFLDMFYAFAGRPPLQTDFTDEQYARLDNYISVMKQDTDRYRHISRELADFLAYRKEDAPVCL